jgi:hypothetical protein
MLGTEAPLAFLPVAAGPIVWSAKPVHQAIEQPSGHRKVIGLERDAVDSFSTMHGE